MPQIDAELLRHATPAELAAYEAALRAEVALSTPADYAEALSGGKFQRPRHVEMLNRTLVDLIEGRLLRPDGTPYRKLMVSMPPRHGKSELISRYTPAWFLTRWPDRKVILASYEADFAASWGRKARDLLLDAPAGLAPALNRDTTAAARWETTAGGAMFTAGVGGPITGKGANLLIIDDPVKNFEDAKSEIKRETAHNWALSTALSRIEPEQLPDGSWGPPGAVVLVMTRWHELDLAGWFLKDEPDEWAQLVLPALAGESDPLGRLPGEALWPERFDAEALAKLQATVGPQIWASLYQQSPSIEGGGIFRAEKFRYFSVAGAGNDQILRLHGDETPKGVPRGRIWTFGVVDLAASTRTTADWSVYGLFGVTPDEELLLLDRFRARIEGADHMSTLERLHGAWKPRFWGIERATFGLTLIQTATRTGRIPVRELKPDWDKVSRAYSAGALVEAGRMYFPKGASWLSEYEQELMSFPNGAHDDQVDVTAYAALVLSQRLGPPRRPKKSEPQTTEERIWAQIARRGKQSKHHPTLGAGF